MDPTSLIPFVGDLVERSGEAIRRHFQRPDLAVETKGDASPVTAADREAESILREAIRARFPDHGIVGEEFGAEHEDAEHVWLLDPIDGTISFVHGVALFGTMIGLLREGRPILGVIHQPITDELVIGAGGSTLLNGRPTRVREHRTLERATLMTTDPGLIETHQPPGTYERFETLRRRAGTFRGWGDCYGYLMVAAGRAEAMLDPVLHPWDLLPLVPVIEGAGGVITTWSGGDPVGGSSAIAAGPGLHAEILAGLGLAGGRDDG